MKHFDHNAHHHGFLLRQVRAVADRVVPGARFRRRLFRRFSTVWRRPAP